MGETAVIPAQIVGVAARSLLANNTASAAACQTVSFSAASAGHVLTVQGDGSVAFAAVSAGIGGSTGSADNAVLRADGAGGTTLQTSGWIVPDIFTASPNATVNHLSLQATGNSTNVSVSIVPKGSGAFSLQVPDGTATGGNARGVRAIDLQTDRSDATQVASGQSSFVCNRLNTGSGFQSFAAGAGNISSGNAAATFNLFNTASGEAAFVINRGNIAEGLQSFAHGFGAYARLVNQYAFANGQFSTVGDVQRIAQILQGKTTTNAAAELFFGSNADQRFVVPAGYIWHGLAIVTGTKSDGSAVAVYIRQIAIKRVVNATSLVGAVVTIGTDQAAGTSLSITADDTNESLKVQPTGVLNETWRWECILDGGLIAFGT
jgi:hypothetical protein